MSFNYRPDIDGLRAVAVIPVVLFHAGVSVFSGGYVGVDIFFVISGYLITGILLRDMKQNRFSILTFYERRIRRIFPLLFTVLLVSSAVALWMLFPTELRTFGKSLVSATFFYSNYHFMFDTGYFTAPMETKPLLHLWSLAVEEQFYIVFPLYLYLVTRFFNYRIGSITVALLILSLIYSIMMVDTLPGDAFYSTPARTWELMLGSVLAIYPRKQPMNSLIANILTLAGISAIAYAVFFYTKETPFPGAMALLPVLGSALILYAGNTDKNIVGSLLATKAFRLPGLISYSLYMWHWPLLVFYKIYAIEPVSDLEISILMGVAVGLSYLSWKFIETPFRSGQILPNQKRLLFAGGSVMLFTALLGIAMVMSSGFPQRHSEEIKSLLATKRTNAKKRTGCNVIAPETDRALRVCQIGSDANVKPSFALWGDSHAGILSHGVNISAKQFNIKGVYAGRPGCLPMLGAQRFHRGREICGDSADTFMLYLEDHPEIKKIILVSRWALHAMGNRYRNEKGETAYIKDMHTKSLSLEENKRVFERSMQRTLDRLSQLGRQVVLVTQTPETEWDIPLNTARAKLLHRDIDLRPKLSDYLDRQAFVTEVIAKYRQKYDFELIQPHKKMCDEAYCMIYEDGIPIYQDSNHLSRAYSEKLSGIFDKIFSTP